MVDRQTGRKTTSVFRGVHRTSDSGWGSKYSGKRIAATCKTAEEAAIAYDEYLRTHLPQKYLKFSNFDLEGRFRNPLGLSIQAIVDIVGKEEAQNLRRRTVEYAKHTRRSPLHAVCSSQQPSQSVVRGSACPQPPYCIVPGSPINFRFGTPAPPPTFAIPCHPAFQQQLHRATIPNLSHLNANSRNANSKNFVLPFALPPRPASPVSPVRCAAPSSRPLSPSNPDFTACCQVIVVSSDNVKKEAACSHDAGSIDI
jgi:hypothetical protein